MMSGTLKSDSTSVDIIVIYRPPRSHSSISTFLDEFSSMLDNRMFKPSPLVITGDFNIHLDNLSSPNTCTLKFNDLLTSHGLSQEVTMATHAKGHILDVFIVCNFDNQLYSDVQVIPGISDHSAITCKLHLTKPHHNGKRVVVRNIKAIDRVSFARNAMQSITPSTIDNVSDAVDQYNSQARILLDSHAPATSRHVKERHDSPWYMYNKDITIAKQKRRCLA